MCVCVAGLCAGTETSGIQNRLGVLFFMLLYLSLMALSRCAILDLYSFSNHSAFA